MTEQASNGCSDTVRVHPSRWNGSTPPAASLASPRGTHQRWVARLIYRLSKPAPDGRTKLLLSPIQLLERLATTLRAVPSSRRAPTRSVGRVHRHRYHGVLARGTRRRWVAKLRAAVTYIGTPQAETPRAPPPSPTRPQPSIDAEPARHTNPARIRWAVLLARIYEVPPLLCPAGRAPRNAWSRSVVRPHEDPRLHHRPARRDRDPRAPRAAPQPPAHLARARPGATGEA